MAKLVALTLALACTASERVKFSPPTRQRLRLVLPNRGERRAAGDRRTFMEIVTA